MDTANSQCKFAANFADDIRGRDSELLRSLQVGASGTKSFSSQDSNEGISLTSLVRWRAMKLQLGRIPDAGSKNPAAAEMPKQITTTTSVAFCSQDFIGSDFRDPNIHLAISCGRLDSRTAYHAL